MSEQNINPGGELERLESLRREGWINFRRVLFLVLLTIVLVYYMKQDVAMHWQFWLVSVGLFLATLIGIPVYYYKKIQKRYKNQFVAPMMHTYFPHYTYQAKEYISKAKFTESRLFHFFNHYTGDDYFSGENNGRNFEFSELNVMQQTSNGKSTQSIQIFAGVFAIFQISEAVDFELTPDVMERFMGKLATKLKFSHTRHGYLIRTTNERFNTLFQLRAEEKEKAEALFNEHTIGKLLNVYDEIKSDRITKSTRGFKKDLWLSVQNGQLFMAIGGVRLFDVPFFKSVEKNTRAFANNIRLINFLVEKGDAIANSVEGK